MVYTTLNRIRGHYLHNNGWGKLLSHLGKTEADDKPLALLTILEVLGYNDALWYLRACDNIDMDARLFAVACLRRVQHLIKDRRLIDVLNVAERYAHGAATIDQLRAAGESAYDVRSDADDALEAVEAKVNEPGISIEDIEAERLVADLAWALANGAVCATQDPAAWGAEQAANAASWAASWDDENVFRCDAELAWQEAEFRRVFCKEMKTPVNAVDDTVVGSANDIEKDIPEFDPRFFPGFPDPIYASLTLRDYFAAKAMQGYLAGPDVEYTDTEIAEVSYLLADAMLEARKKTSHS
jgi:hypothetical protein